MGVNRSNSLSSSIDEMWESYEVIYHTSQASIHQTMFLSAVTGEIFKDFPTGLPPAFGVKYQKLLTDLIKAIESTKRSPDGRYHVDYNAISGDEEFSSIAIMMVVESAIAKRGVPTPKSDVSDFDRFLTSLQLVMLFAYIDAFLADTIRIVCRARPEVLKKQSKKIAYDRVIASRSLHQLKDELVDDFAFELGRQTDIKGRLKFFKDHFGIVVKCPATDLQGLAKLERIRDIVVHNGGRVSLEFMRKTGEKRFALGQVYPLTSKEIRALALFARRLSGSIFVEVSTKFLKRELSQISSILEMFPK